jgi:hypothetical protein
LAAIRPQAAFGAMPLSFGNVLRGVELAFHRRVMLAQDFS